VLLNNAAYTSGHALTQPLWEMSREDWELQFATNVHAPFSLIKAIVPHMRDQGGGVVVNVTSRAYEMHAVGGDSERFGAAGPWAYGASKAALNRMTNGMAAQLYEYGIAVIAMEPGFVRTEFVDLMSERRAFDASAAIPMSVPARVVAHLSGSGAAMRYTGQVVSAPELYAELSL
jgi:NAD(P)-dependent dehydrogenase (short-subunit alcohol dehydrogenase family)